MNNIPRPALGTALWAWTIPRAVCFELLDLFYERGGRQVDTATNYPIDKNPEHWRAAERILHEWIETHQIKDLEVCIKVGSVNNMKSPTHLLSNSFLRMNLDRYQKEFGSNLHTYMIHWDNRTDPADSYPALAEAQAAGLRVGLSGIKHPAVHAELCRSHQIEPRIQTKYNLLHDGIAHYAEFGDGASFMVYGINAGGLKLDGNYRPDASYHARGGTTPPAELLLRLRNLRDHANSLRGRSSLRTFNQFGMIHAAAHPRVESILLGTSRPEQLQNSLDFLQTLATEDYGDVVMGMRQLSNRP